MWSFDCPSRTIDHSDEKVLYDPEIYEQLLEGGVDQLMAQHVAHLFIRHHHYHLVNFFLKWPHNVITFWSTAHLKRSFFAQGFREHVHQQSEEGWRLWWGEEFDQSGMEFENIKTLCFGIILLSKYFYWQGFKIKNNKIWARKDLELILIPWFKY